MRPRQATTRRDFLRLGALGAASAAVLAACTPADSAAPAATPLAQARRAASPTPTVPRPTETPGTIVDSAGRLEVFSWWTSGSDAEGLGSFLDTFRARCPRLEVVNPVLAAAEPSSAQTVLQTRMQQGNPPDSFQVHLGRELIDAHVTAGRMEPLDELYVAEDWDKVLPKQVVDIACWRGKPWAVPVSIFRANVLWYSEKALQSVGDGPPTNWKEFFATAEKLRARNLPALGLTENAPGQAAHVFETVLISILGTAKYCGLFEGTTKWDDPGVVTAIGVMNDLFDYANPDYLGVGWGNLGDLLTQGKVAMLIDGDWMATGLWARGFQDFRWAPSPGNLGIFDTVADSFGLPKGCKDREAAIAWLKVCGSREGQDALNPARGSIPARTDPNPGRYSAYHQSAIEEWRTNQLVPSVVHGSAAKESFVADFQTAVNVLANRRNVAEAQGLLLKAAEKAAFSR